MVSYNIKEGNPDGSTTFLARVNAQVIPREGDIIRMHAVDENAPANAPINDNPDEFIVAAVIHDIERGANAARNANTQTVSVIVKKI